MFVVSRRRVSRTAAGDDGCMFVVWWWCVRSVLRVVSSCCSKLRLLRAASTCGFYTASSCGFYARLLRAASSLVPRTHALSYWACLGVHWCDTALLTTTTTTPPTTPPTPPDVGRTLMLVPIGKIPNPTSQGAVLGYVAGAC